MNAAYIVHAASPGDAEMPVKLADGTEVQARVAALTVELVSAPGSAHGSITLRFVGAEVAPAIDLFTPGRALTASFAGA